MVDYSTFFLRCKPPEIIFYTMFKHDNKILTNT